MLVCDVMWHVRIVFSVFSDLHGGRVQVGQPHVCRVLRGWQVVHRWDETVCFLLHVVQEAEHTEVWPDGDGELRLGVPVVLWAVLLLLQKHKEVKLWPEGDEATSCCGVTSEPSRLKHRSAWGSCSVSPQGKSIMTVQQPSALPRTSFVIHVYTH